MVYLRGPQNAPTSQYYLLSIYIFKPLSTFLQPVTSIYLSNIIIKFLECQELDPGLLGENQDCYLCALKPPKSII